jgi:parvulin-like peptidyl-prolyl isomerase
VITVGSEKITRSQFEQIAAALPERQREELKDPAGRKKLAGQLAELMTLAQEGRARKLDQTAKMRIQMDQVIATAVYQELAAVKPDEAALKAYYEAHKADWMEAKARHILIRFTGSRGPARPGQPDLAEADALKKANEVRAKIAGGADFAVIAKAESDDTGSGAAGGDLGKPFGKGSMVAEFDAAAFSLPIGELSQPVRSMFGFHLIQVQERTTKPFEAVRAEIEQKMKPEMAQKGIDALKKKSVVVYDETYFGK